MTADLREAIALAFVALYQQWGEQIDGLLTAKEPQQRQTGFVLAGLEYENLLAALDAALTRQLLIAGIYQALDQYWDATQEHQRGIAVGLRARAALAQYPAERLRGQDGFFLMRVSGDLAARLITRHDYQEAAAIYQAQLPHIEQLHGYPAQQRGQWKATVYHELGRVAQAQRQWAQAQQHFQQALAIKIEFNDRYSQASTYHHLGIVAEAQRQWAQAQQHFQQALALKNEFNDRYSQASTYHQLGMVAQEQRQWAQAQQHFQQALALYVEFNDRYSQAKTYHQLGSVAQEQRQWAQAQQHFQQALALYVEFNDRYNQAGTYGQLGLLAEEQGQLAEASTQRLQALAIFAEFGDQHSMGIVLRSLARLRAASGDATLAAAVAQAIGIREAEAEQLLAERPPKDEPEQQSDA